MVRIDLNSEYVNNLDNEKNQVSVFKLTFELKFLYNI